jgi:IclR family pca regulon transcriptional regulator
MPTHATEAGADKKSTVQSLAKAFRVLEAIAASEAEMTLSEIAAASELDPGTTHRMLNTMIQLGYVVRLEGKRFGLSLKVLDLGFHAIGRQDLRGLARPLLRSLVGEVSEAASVGVLTGADVLYVERMRAGVTRLGVDIRVGTLIPAATTMIGWCILAMLPEAELRRVLRLESRQRDFREIPPPADLMDQLALARAQGYALSPSKISSGLTVLAVPITDKDGYPVAGISVAAPSIRMNPEELRALALEPLRDAARTIARGLEASGGASAG